MAKFLVIDGNRHFAMSFSHALRARAHDAAVVDDGRSALEEVTTISPDVIIVRVELEGPNGFAVCNRLKRDPEQRHTPVILFSETMPESAFEQHQKLTSRAQVYVGGPIAPDELASRAEALLPSAGRHGEGAGLFSTVSRGGPNWIGDVLERDDAVRVKSLIEQDEGEGTGAGLPEWATSPMGELELTLLHLAALKGKRRIRNYLLSHPERARIGALGAKVKQRKRSNALRHFWRSRRSMQQLMDEFDRGTGKEGSRDSLVRSLSQQVSEHASHGHLKPDDLGDTFFWALARSQDFRIGYDTILKLENLMLDIALTEPGALLAETRPKADAALLDGALGRLLRLSDDGLHLAACLCCLGAKPASLETFWGNRFGLEPKRPSSSRRYLLYFLIGEADQEWVDTAFAQVCCSYPGSVHRGATPDWSLNLRLFLLSGRIGSEVEAQLLRSLLEDVDESRKPRLRGTLSSIGESRARGDQFLELKRCIAILSQRVP